MEKLKCGKYIEFDFHYGTFVLTKEANEIMNKEKKCIRSYSGADEWCNHIFCQLIDLYSGLSPFNMEPGAYEHESQIKYFWIKNRYGVEHWIKKYKDSEWFKIACETFETIFENIPEM